jgi:hypothetical protein
MSRGCGASVRSPYHSIVPRVGDVPPPPSSMLGCDTIEIDQAVLIAAKVTMTATMMVSLFVIDMGCSRGFHQTETASADSMESTLSRSRQVVMDRTGKMKIVTLPRCRHADERHSYGLYRRYGQYRPASRHLLRNLDPPAWWAPPVGGDGSRSRRNAKGPQRL